MGHRLGYATAGPTGAADRKRREEHAVARRFLANVLFGLAAAGAAAGASERTPPVDSVSAVYDLNVGGLGAGELTLEATIGEERYRARAAVTTTGIVGVFIDQSWRGVTRGEVQGERLRPVHYSSQYEGDEGKQAREVRYEAGRPVSVHPRPKEETRPWSIDAEDQAGTVDPVTAILSLLAPAREGAACDRRIVAYDGKHRFAFELDRARRRAGGIRCPGAYVRLAGYKPEKMEDARRPFTLFLERGEDGLLEVARIESDTLFGTAVLGLRD